MSSRIPDHVTIVTEAKTEAGTDYVTKGRAMVNMDRYPFANSPLIVFCVKKTGGGSGWVRIHDATTSEVLVEQEITQSDLTDFALELSNFPQTGLGKFECQLKSDGTGEIDLRCCSLEIM